jgi:acyl-CoA thioester hydrolase
MQPKTTEIEVSKVPEGSMLFFAPFVSSLLTLRPEWIDYNGHLNMAYYQVLFDTAVDEAFALCGLGPEYVRENNHSFFLVESRIRYRQELAPTDKVRVTVQLVAFDDKRLHYCMQIRHALHGWLAASCENLSVHVNLVSRKVAPFPADVMASLAVMRDAHALLARPDGLGEGVVMPMRLQ